MFEALHQHLEHLLGLNAPELLFVHMGARVLMVYVAGIFILNVINKRFIGENTPFDIVLRFIIGSSLASAIVGGSPFWPTLGMVFFIVLVNWLLSLLSFYSRTIEKLLKSEAHVVYKNGKFLRKPMRRYHITEEDLLSEIRKDCGLKSFDEVDEILIEGSGEFSVIPKISGNAQHHRTRKHDVD
jgi:uncharacterized membrane protein YcaP (DUF421 family)